MNERKTELGEVTRKLSFYLPSNYSMSEGAHTQGYDFAFVSQYECCRVGEDFFENGQGSEAFTKYAQQSWYPEGRKRTDNICWPNLEIPGEEVCVTGEIKSYTQNS